jgi:hypothetical protein
VRLKAITMRNFLSAVWRLRFKRHDGTAQKANACRPSHIKACHRGDFASKSGQCSPDRGWRLLVHIGYTSTTAKIDQTHDIELNEELLERIDFFACLCGSRKIE